MASDIVQRLSWWAAKRVSPKSMPTLVTDCKDAKDHIEDQDRRIAELEAGWQEPPLTCPHIDKAVASGALPPEVIEELAAIRDINSQLRYGTWYLKARGDELEAEVIGCQGRLDAAIEGLQDARAEAFETAIEIIAMEAQNLSCQPARLQKLPVASRHFIRKIRKRMPVDTGEIRNDDP